MKWMTRAGLVVASGVFCAFACPLVAAFVFVAFSWVAPSTAPFSLADVSPLAKLVFVPAALSGAVAGVLAGCVLVPVIESPKQQKYLLVYAVDAGALLGFAFPALDYVLPWVQRPNFNVSFAAFTAFVGIVCALGSALFLRFLHANI
jgi:membrane associated rhomboid family serine protease